VPSIIDCEPDKQAIAEAIRAACRLGQASDAQLAELPFGQGQTAQRVAALLASLPLENLLMKPFHDIKELP